MAERTYTYDTLGRPTARHTARQGRVVIDTFAHNSRSELVDAQVNGKGYEYAYDNIGNREFALEDGKASMYEANELNQYTAIAENGAAAFVPMFDADGNQTLIKTETGIWSTVYNAENRPVSFSNSESNTVVECAYDSQGRRAYKKVTVNGSVTLHQRYIYRGYLQIAALDLTRTAHPALWYITWDPTQPVATRPLAIQINGTWYTYGWDLTKNICELYSTEGRISTSYTYSPFGQVITSGDVTQPIQWSSEVWDGELGLVYYNWRFYNKMYGRWHQLDFISHKNLYSYCYNNAVFLYDYVGLAATQEEIEKKFYHFSINKHIQLDDSKRDYKNKCHKNWLLFGGHTHEALRLIKERHRDYFGEIKSKWFEKIAIMSCAPDLTNSLLPVTKRFEELTKPYIPPINHLPSNIQKNLGTSIYLIPSDAIKEVMISEGFEYNHEHQNNKYYEIPGRKIHNELKMRLEIMKNEASKTRQRVIIHVRCSPDILGMELATFVPSGLSDKEMENYLENQTKFNSICGKTVIV